MSKYALCVGNNYVGTPNQLSGCVNDANDWAALLSEAGYKTVPLIEGTSVDTLAWLNDLIRQMGRGDRLVFTYSGHGTWVNDVDGDEEDQRDEALYMTDGLLILDDQLQEVFSQLPTGSGALILSDSCHSGTVSRNMADLSTALGNGTPRFISPAHFTDMSVAQAQAVEQITSVKPSRRTASLISGCADVEYSYDAWFGDRANGAFTRAAIDAYTPGASLSGWYKAIRNTLPSSEYPQTPQVTYASLYRRYAKAL